MQAAPMSASLQYIVVWPAGKRWFASAHGAVIHHRRTSSEHHKRHCLKHCLAIAL